MADILDPIFALDRLVLAGVGGAVVAAVVLVALVVTVACCCKSRSSKRQRRNSLAGMGAFSQGYWAGCALC